jgi:hypothetical protein
MVANSAESTDDWLESRLASDLQHPAFCYRNPTTKIGIAVYADVKNLPKPEILFRMTRHPHR